MTQIHVKIQQRGHYFKWTLVDWMGAILESGFAKGKENARKAARDARAKWRERHARDSS